MRVFFHFYILSLAIHFTYHRKFYGNSGSCKKIPIESGLMSSVFKNLDADLALDGDMETFCHSQLESEPFILVTLYIYP